MEVYFRDTRSNDEGVVVGRGRIRLSNAFRRLPRIRPRHLICVADGI